jgi:hypothetical protein
MRPFCTSIAQRTSPTTLRTSTRLPSAVGSTRNYPAVFGLILSGRWSRAIEWRGST